MLCGVEFFCQIACFSLKSTEVVDCLSDVVVDVIQTARVSAQIAHGPGFRTLVVDICRYNNSSDLSTYGRGWVRRTRMGFRGCLTGNFKDRFCG